MVTINYFFYHFWGGWREGGRGLHVINWDTAKKIILRFFYGKNKEKIIHFPKHWKQFETMFIFIGLGIFHLYLLCTNVFYASISAFKYCVHCFFLLIESISALYLFLFYVGNLWPDTSLFCDRTCRAQGPFRKNRIFRQKHHVGRWVRFEKFTFLDRTNM